MIEFQEVDTVPDALDASRFEVKFGTVPGGADGYQLGLRHGTGTFPAAAIAQVSAKFPGGHSRRFRGGSATDGTWSLTFIEDQTGFVAKSFRKWLKKCRDSKTSKSSLKKDYAIDVEVIWYDTVGDEALTYEVKGIFPLSVEKPTSSENSGPAQITVTFSLDSMDLKD